jgi:hypothetical protein
MEVNQLTAFILLLVLTGMLLGVGVLTIDKFSRATRTTTTVTSTGLNLSAASSVDFAQTYCLKITSVANATASYAVSKLTYSDADTCTMTNAGITGCGPAAAAYCNITYTYGAATESSDATDDVNTAITPIASTWLPLIVTVAILAIILTLVISSFMGVGRTGKD